MAKSVSILGMYSKWLGIGTAAFALSLLTIGGLVTVFVVVFGKRSDRIFPPTPYLALRRRADSFLALCAVLLLALLLPSLLYGVGGNLRLLRGWSESTFGTSIPNLTSQDSVSILGMYSKWLGIGAAAFALSLLTIGVLVTVFVVLFGKRSDRIFPEYLEMSLLLTLIPLFSPSGWDYTLLVSTPAIMCLFNYFGDLSPGMRVVTGIALFAIGFSLYDVLGRGAYASFMSYSLITVCYFVVVTSLYRLRASGVV